MDHVVAVGILRGIGKNRIMTTTDNAIARFLNYSFEPIGWRYAKLTEEERGLCSRAEFDELVGFYRRVTGVDPTKARAVEVPVEVESSGHAEGPRALRELVDVIAINAKAAFEADRLADAMALVEAARHLLDHISVAARAR